MAIPRITPRNLAERSELKLAALGVSAVAALWLGFLGVEAKVAQSLLMRGGYHVMMGSFFLWLVTLYWLWQRRTPGVFAWSRREWGAATLLIATCCCIALTQESFRSKVLYDEFVLQSTAFNMHHFREVGVMVRGYDILGTFMSLDNYLDKRPYFYPYLVSLVHDLSGYRPLNAIVLNTLLLPVSLGLAYWLGRGLAGARGGLLAAGLLGTLPLLAQAGTSSGMDLVNVVMLLASIALAGAWLARPEPTRLSAFVLCIILFAQCRYESPLYVVAALAVIAAGWWRARSIVVSWPAILGPLLLVPVAWHQRVLSESPVLWEMRPNQTSRFGLEHLQPNLAGAAGHLFSMDGRQANSPILAALGLLALVGVAALVAWRIWRGPRTRSAQQLPWVLFGLVIVANTSLVQFYFWGSWSDPMASRFALPFYLLLAFAVVVMWSKLDRRWATPGWMFAVLAIGVVGSSVPRQAQHYYSHMGIDEIEWERRWVGERAPVSRLILTNKSSLPWLMDKTPAILLPRARILQDRLRLHLERHTFSEILVMQSLRPTSSRGDHQIVPEEELPPGFKLEFVTEKRFGTKLARISRLTAIETESGG